MTIHVPRDIESQIVDTPATPNGQPLRDLGALGPADALASLLHGIQQNGRGAALTFHVLRSRRCHEACACRCHDRMTRTSPKFLNNVLGMLFFRYVGLPVISSSCNVVKCSNQYSRIVRISYTFPSWFLFKTVEMVAAMSFANKPQFGLVVKNRISPYGSNDIFWLARQGQTRSILKLFERRLASPNDISATTGETPLRVSMTSPQSARQMTSPVDGFATWSQ